MDIELLWFCFINPLIFVGEFTCGGNLRSTPSSHRQTLLPVRKAWFISMLETHPGRQRLPRPSNKSALSRPSTCLEPPGRAPRMPLWPAGPATQTAPPSERTKKTTVAPTAHSKKISGARTGLPKIVGHSLKSGHREVFSSATVRAHISTAPGPAWLPDPNYSAHRDPQRSYLQAQYSTQVFKTILGKSPSLLQ